MGLRKIYLHESVGGGRGRHTAVSVLTPYIRIERTDEAEYRVIATFKLQVKIHAFEKGYQRRCEKLFDFVSLRYLYHDPERHKVHPSGDRIARLTATSDATTSRGFTAGFTGDAALGVLPTAEVSVQSDNTLSYERATKSWRRGFSYEPYAKCNHKWDPPGYKGQGAINHHWRRHHFRVDCQRANQHSCCGEYEPKCEPGASCGYRDPTDHGQEATRYNRCAHWFWQTEAAAHLWAPETYESFSEYITVTRTIPVHVIQKDLDDRNQKKLHRFLHFDFVVTSRLRELGWTWKDYMRRSSKPAEIRAKGDYGYPLATDRVAFCLCCCVKDVHGFPHRPTRALQLEAEKEVAEHGPTVRCLLSTKDWKDKRRVEKHKKDNKEKKETQLEDLKRQLIDMEFRAQLDRIDRELHNKPCNCSGHQEPDIDFFNHTIHHFSPEKYEKCHCRPDKHGEHQPCNCSPHSRPPETDIYDHDDDNGHCPDCCLKGQCRCRSVSPSESRGHETTGTPRGRSRVKREGHDEHILPMPEADGFFHLHRHYRSHSRSHHRSLSEDGARSPVPRFEEYSIHPSITASPAVRAQDHDQNRYNEPLAIHYPEDRHCHTNVSPRPSSRDQLERDLEELRARINQLEGQEDEETEPARNRRDEKWSNESITDDSSGDETIDNRHEMWGPEPEAETQWDTARPDHRHDHRPSHSQPRPGYFVLSRSSHRSQHRGNVNGRAIARSLSPRRHARPENLRMYEERGRALRHRHDGIEYGERSGRATSTGARIVELVAERPLPRGHRRSREYWRY